MPTALKILFGRLDDLLQGIPQVPSVVNPVLRSERLDGAWDQTKYANFRNVWHRYRGWIDDAYDEVDRNESIAKWRRVFGDEFAGAVVIEEAASVSDRAVEVGRRNVVLASARVDLVDLVKARGELALPDGFARLPHMRRPAWPKAVTASIAPSVRATRHAARNGGSMGGVQSLQSLPPNGYLRFEAFNRMGLPLPDDYRVEWRISNTDRVAARANALRGDFYKSDSHGVRWEALQYRGVHIAEAFVVRKAGGLLVGQSDPFFVVIE